MSAKQLFKNAFFFSSLLFSLGGIAQNTFPATGSVGIGTSNPLGVLDVNGVNATAWSYFRANANGFNPSTNYGLMTAWNSSGGLGETHILYGTGVGSGPRLDFGRWTGSVKINDMSLVSGSVGIGTTAPSTKIDVLGSATIGSSTVNTNNTKLFLRNTTGKVWALSSGSNMMSETDFAIYNWTDYPTNPLLSINSGGNIGVKGVLTIKDVAGYLVGGTIKPGPDGLITSGGNKHTIFAAQEVRIDAPQLLAKKVKVSIQPADWADYVFASDYSLRSLTSVESFINQHKHLPDVPSAQEVGKNNLDLGATQALLLRKIEELTLYMIQQDKTIKSQQKMLESFKGQIKKHIK